MQSRACYKHQRYFQLKHSFLLVLPCIFRRTSSHIPYNHNLVVNHKNFIRTDNRLENLEIVTARENTNRKHLKSSSIYTGVCWDKNRKKWFSSIKFLGKDIFLGRFDCELEAKNAYDKKLIELSKY